MNFNIDDPLADILSDGSDDSFFGDDLLGKKKPARKNSTTEKKTSLFDLGDDEHASNTNLVDRKNSLFDLEEPTSKATPITATAVTDNKNIEKDLRKTTPPFKRSISKDSDLFQNIDVIKTPTKQFPSKYDSSKSPSRTRISSSAEKIDKYDEKSTDSKPTRPLEKGKSSQSLLDDILGGSSTKLAGTSQSSRPTTAAKSQEFDFNSILGKSDSKPGITQPNKKPQIENTRPERKEEKQTKSKMGDDWLGVFESKEEPEDMPSWLTGTDTKKKSTDTVKKPKPEIVLEKPSSAETQIESHKEVVNPKELSFNRNLEQMPTSIPTGILGSHGDDVTAEGAALYLQQQESQLMVALQLKAQEERLAEMQTRQEESQRIQREATRARSAQVDALLQRHGDQRAQMQAVIAAHQERINQRITALLGPPPDNGDGIDGEANINYHTNESITKDSPRAKEKKQLLQLVQSLQENHDKEIELMESSYRRQLAFIEISLNQTEERMKEDTDKQMKYYMEKIQWLEGHHLSYKLLTEDSMKILSDRHNSETAMLRQQHLENVKVLQEHHAALMENIKNAVKQEQNLIRDSAQFSSDLLELVDQMKESKTVCQTLASGVQDICQRTQGEAERAIRVRETQIDDMIQQLKRERDNFESEKNENRDMAKLLEVRLKQVTQFVEEQSATLKQKRMEFEFEKATFNKQTEFAKNVLKKQEEEIKMIREDIDKEYQEKRVRIEEEKSKASKETSLIAKERMTAQTLRQELERMKAELQSQLEELTEERSKLNMDKQQMQMDEQTILAKSRDLELLTKTTRDRQSQADRKQSEAEYIQNKYEERIKRIQDHAASLNAREKQIAKEKVTLSRERLNLHNERRQIENKQCSLCKAMLNSSQYANYEDKPDFFNASRDYGNPSVSVAMNAIETEMAHLMGRNLGLRNMVSGNFEMGHTVENHDSVGVSVISNYDGMKEFDDPKLLLLRYDVEQVISNLDHNTEERIDVNL